MSLSWWMWLGGGAVLAAALSGLHWTFLDFLLDRPGAEELPVPERQAEEGT